MSKGSFAKTRFFFSALCFLAVVFCAQGSLFAQTTGTILGTVTDQTDAVLPGAGVMVTNVETGIARSTVADDRGAYRVTNLPPGTYEVQASLAGFQTAVRSGITLTIGREAAVDFTLQVGDVTQQVTVTGEAPLIETTSSSVSGVVDSQQMRNIPLNSRSFLEMVPLQTGAVFAEAGASSATKGFGRKLSISGTRYNANSFLLDGASMNDAAGVAGSAAQTMAGVETVREFRVVTNAYDSEYGKHIGGVISAVTKSGTNEIHGSVFEFLRNDNLDSPNYFDDPNDIPEFRRNQFGAAVGGPIVRDQSFFFASFEALREGKGLTRTFNVPGMDARNGIIDGENIGVDPAIAPWLAAYPVPNQPDRADGTAQFITARTQVTDQNFWMVRIDHRFSDADSLFGRFNLDNAVQFRPDRMNTGAEAKTGSRFATLEETHIYSPKLIGKTHFSFSRTRLDFFDIELEGFTYPQWSLGSAPDVSGTISVSGLSGWGGGSTNPKRHIQNNYQFKEDFNYVSGRHAVKFGGHVERLQFNQRSDFYAGGNFSFGGLDDFLVNNVSRGRFIKPGSDNIRGWRESLFGFYFQDDINLKPGLTLNVGLRYEFVTVPTEANGKVATIRDLRPEHFYSVTPETTDVGDPMFVNPSLKNFAPRVGFAWDPFQAGKTSFRGGIGLFHDQILPNSYITSGVRVAPFYSVAELLARDIDIDFPNAYVSQGDVLVTGGGRPQVDGFQYYVSQPAAYKWSLNIQQEIIPSTTIDVGYSGLRGTHLIRGALLLNSTPAEIRNGRRYFLIDEPQPNPYWNRMRWRKTDGTSNYHAFRLSLNRRFSQGLQLQSSYTFSKSTDDSSTWTGSSDFGAADRRGYLGEKEPALSAFDVRQSFVTNLVYELPSGNLTGAAEKFLGGWSLSSILRFNSGNPFSLTADQPRKGRKRLVYVDGSRLDLVPGGNQNPIRPQNPDEYFDASQFGFPEPFYQGNLGRNHIFTPGVANVDFTVMKDTSLAESTTLQFRAEFFNLFNRANFNSPAGRSLFDRRGNPRSNAGEITGTRTTSRQIQVALKLIF